jgi:hypothetical protein
MTVLSQPWLREALSLGYIVIRGKPTKVSDEHSLGVLGKKNRLIFRS